MIVSTDDIKYCPLKKRDIRWGYCYEIQEVREDNMDMEHLDEPIDLEQAAKVCEKCEWRNSSLA